MPTRQGAISSSPAHRILRAESRVREVRITVAVVALCVAAASGCGASPATPTSTSVPKTTSALTPSTAPATTQNAQAPGNGGTIAAAPLVHPVKGSNGNLYLVGPARVQALAFGIDPGTAKSAYPEYGQEITVTNTSTDVTYTVEAKVTFSVPAGVMGATAVVDTETASPNTYPDDPENSGLQPGLSVTFWDDMANPTQPVAAGTYVTSQLVGVEICPDLGQPGSNANGECPPMTALAPN